MKAKFLSLLLALTCVGAGVCTNAKNAKSVNAENTYKLSFDSLVNDFCCSESTNGWWDSVYNDTYSVTNNVLTLDFAKYKGNPVMVGYYNAGVMETKANHYYKLEFEMKNSNFDTFQLYAHKNNTEWNEIATIGNEGEGWHSFSYTFKSFMDQTNFAFQQGTGLSTVQFRDMYIYDIGRDLTYEEEIGDFPPLPQGAIGWGIDGTPITSTSTFDFKEDKVAKPIYETSLVNYFTINGANIAKNPNTFPTGNPFNSVNYHDNQIDIESPFGTAYHLTNEYEVESGKTYYLIGKYKTTVGSGIHIGINDPWQLAVEDGFSRQYTPFKLKYTAASSRKIQFIFQSGHQNQGVARFSIKDIYFGEALEINFGSSFTDLPEPEQYTDGWKINDNIISKETLNLYGTNENIDTYIKNPWYNVSFPIYKFVSNEAKEVELANVGDVYCESINVKKDCSYFVSFEFNTSFKGETDKFWGIKPWIITFEDDKEIYNNVGYEGVTSGGNFATLSFTYTADHDGVAKICIQNAYNQTDPNTGGVAPFVETKFEIKNYFCNEVLKLRKDDQFTYLPELPESKDPLLIPEYWMINNEEIQIGSTYNSQKDEIASIYYDTATFELSFDDGGEIIKTSSIKYGETIGELPETPTAREGYHYVWGIDGTEIDSSTIYNFAENKTATLIEKVNIYTISFVHDGRTLENKPIEYGSKISEFPEYEASDDYIYHWEIDNETVTVDTVYNFASNKVCELVKVLKTYTATFMAGDVIVGTATFNKEGYLETLPNVPEKEGYDGIWNEVITFPNHDMTVEASYSPKTFEIYFVDDAGNRIAMFRIKYGQSFFEVCPSWPQAPEKEGYTFKSYQLNGKDVSLQDVFMYTSNQMITATYTKNEEKPVEPEKKGCGSSIIAASAIVSCLSLAGVTLIASKKNKEDK